MQDLILESKTPYFPVTSAERVCIQKELNALFYKWMAQCRLEFMTGIHRVSWFSFFFISEFKYWS